MRQRSFNFYKVISRDYKLSLGLMTFGLFVIVGIMANDLAHPESVFISFGPETATQSSPIYKAPGYIEVMADGNSRMHVLGTDQLGRDVLSRMIHGTRLTLIVGLVSTGISFLIALLLGSLAGYFGDNKIQVNFIDILIGIGGIIGGISFLAYNATNISEHGQSNFDVGKTLVIILFLLTLFFALRKVSSRLNLRKWLLPLDSIIVKLLEVFRAIPALFLIIALFSLIQHPSIWTVVFIIGVLRWGTMTRLLRAEIMQLKTENYIISARLMGLSEWRILAYHIWPNAIGPMIVSACFYIGTAVLIEATLSFLGIGVPVNVVTWGNMLSTSRAYIGAWWLALFPGLAIFLLILSVTIIGDRLRKRLKKG
jgi:peptide/nickel transport system permease protein